MALRFATHALNHIIIYFWMTYPQRPLYRHYYQNTDALMYVVDNADGLRLPETKEELSQLLGEEDLERIPLLVMANKQDLLEAKSAPEVTEHLQLNKLRRRGWGEFSVSAFCNQNDYEPELYIKAQMFPHLKT